jgi:glycine cleavage system regulatory protein
MRSRSARSPRRERLLALSYHRRASHVEAAMTTSLVMTAIGSDRPGIVNALSDVAQRFGANWAGSRMASLAGQFAGMVHFEVAEENAEALSQALRGLEAMGLRVVIVKSETWRTAPAGRRAVRLELVGHDRAGIVRELSGSLAKLDVSIEELHTQVVSAAMSGERLFKVKASLALPAAVANEQLQQALEGLANEMMVDIELAERA